MRRFIAAFLAAALLAVPASAHQPGTSSLVLVADPDGKLRGEIHAAEVDLAAIEMMLNDQARRRGLSTAHRVEDLPWLRLRADETIIAFTPGEPHDGETDGKTYIVLPFAAEAVAGKKLIVEYENYFDFDPQHTVVTSLEAGGTTRVGLISYENPRWETTLREPGPAGQFVQFTIEGVWHIWIGIDHILFLLALLLPAVLRHEGGRWQPVSNFREALLNVLKVVTAFTAAHSITLSLAALQIVTLPGKIVESVIALSVLLAAVNNIWPVVRDRVWLVAFGFGLIHGFGFASVLADLQLPTGTLAIALVSFNVGVELGQLAIVSAFFPLAFAVRARRFYQPVKLRLGSAAIAVVAIGWIVQRVFEVPVVPF